MTTRGADPRRIIVLSDEPLLRTVLCEAIERSIPNAVCIPAASRAEVDNELASCDIAVAVLDTWHDGTNISRWIGRLLMRCPRLGLVVFSETPPTFAEAQRSGRVTYVEKAGENVSMVVEACRRFC